MHNRDIPALPDVSTLVRTLRLLAASLITLSGIGHIAALWMRELSTLAVLDMLTGGVYLIIGLGLFGQSRFSLFMAILIPAANSAALYLSFPEPDQHYLTVIIIDLIIMLCSLIVLWQVRKHPSV
tara:strand:+ start:14611 stop:14985 length:375 start_codon:yes stop_codon:yes gene_type:complete